MQIFNRKKEQEQDQPVQTPTNPMDMLMPGLAQQEQQPMHQPLQQVVQQQAQQPLSAGQNVIIPLPEVMGIIDLEIKAYGTNAQAIQILSILKLKIYEKTINRK